LRLRKNTGGASHQARQSRHRTSRITGKLNRAAVCGGWGASSLNALRHGLTARTAELPTEDPEASQRHIQQFLDTPATPNTSCATTPLSAPHPVLIRVDPR